MKRSFYSPSFFFVAVAGLMVCACDEGKDKEDPAERFLEVCTSDRECPEDWVCPNRYLDGNGAIGGICTPECTDDVECRETLARPDVFCYFERFCAVECSAHEECPEVLPKCRGSDPDCAPFVDPPFWCAAEDLDCPSP
jgi:hypothetical protein